MGPGRYQEKLIDLILEKGKSIPSLSPVEIQSKIIEIGREIKRLHETSENLKIRLSSCGESPEKIEEMFTEIHYAIHGVKK